MQKLPINAVKNWVNWASYFIPKSIKTNCPHCSELAIFTMINQYSDMDIRNAIYCSALCPACDQKSHFFCMNPQVKDTQKEGIGALFIYPEIKNIRKKKDYSKYIPEQLQNSYESALNSYNSKNYIATAVGCRRTLEGIFYYILSADDRKKNLAAAIESAKGTIDWAEPLNNLAHLIRKGGNLGAHFDESKEPNEMVSKAMIDLLEYLFEYLYELPQNISKLESDIANA